MHLQDGPQIDLSAQVARVREKARPWRSIIALVLALAALAVSAWAHRHFRYYFAPAEVPSQVIAAGCAVAFCFLGSAATIGLSGNARTVLEPRTGPSHAAVVRYALLLAGGFATLVITLLLFSVPVGQLVLGGALTSVFVGIAAQQALSNVFAGIVLLLARPFRVGDAVQLRAGALGGPLEGTVTEIGITYVRLDTGTSIMSVPNSQVLNAVVGPLPPSAAGSPAPSPAGPSAGSPAPSAAGSPAPPPAGSPAPSAAGFPAPSAAGSPAGELGGLADHVHGLPGDPEQADPAWPAEARPAEPLVELPGRVHLRPGAEVDEQPEEVRGGRPAATGLGEDVHHGQRTAGRERLADPAEEGGDPGTRQMVDKVEAEHRVIPAAQVRRGRVPVAVPDPARHPGPGDDLPADRRAARQVEHGRGEPGVAPAQLGRVPAVAAPDVQQGPRVAGQPQLPGHLGGAEPGKLELAADVAAPVRVAGRRAMVAGGLPAAGDLV